MAKGFFASIRWTHIFILLTLTGAVFYLISQTFNVTDFSQTMAEAEASWIIAGVAVSLTGTILGTWRWQAFLAMIGHRIPFKRIFLINMANGPLMLLPGRAGDFVRAYALKHEIPMSHTVGTIVLEKVIDISALLLFAIVGGLLAGYTTFAAWAGIVLTGIVITLGLLIRFRSRLLAWVPAEKIRILLERLSHILPFVVSHKQKLAIGIASSLANWSTNMVMVYCFFRAVHAPVPLGTVFALLPLGIFVGLIPLTIAGMGTRDSALIALFAPFASASQSLGVGILYSAFTYWLAIIMGIPFFRHMQPMKSLEQRPTE